MPETSTTRWFRPPRAHGDIIEDRTVSFLELFYDLVFVLLIAQIAHTLADHVSWVGVRDFAVVFGLIWIAWINGTLYHDLHGGEDGRSRSYIFAQMALLVMLAVFTAHAADDPSDGRGFAAVYTVLLLLISWQWFDVRRFDSPEWRRVASGYVAGLLVIASIVFASVFVSDPETRILLWTIATGLSLVSNIGLALRPQLESMAKAIHPTESLVERFGLFTIIVLGEVVVGVADGLSAADRSLLPLATGILALSIGFGFWWNYFDFVGGRVPTIGRQRVAWIFGHLPLAVGISAAGAGMVSLIEHSGDSRTPTGTAWLVGGATATVALSILMLVLTIAPHPARRGAPFTLAAAALASIIIAASRPTPWLMALLLSLAMSVVWLEAFVRHRRHDLMITDRV